MRKYIEMATHRFLVEAHLELVEVHPLDGVLRTQVVVVVPRLEAERVEFPGRGKEENAGGLLVDDPRVPPLPLGHHVDGSRVVNEAEGIAAERSACVDNVNVINN